MQVSRVITECYIGTGKTTLLQTFEWSLSGKCKVTIKVEHEPIKQFQSFYGNDLIKPVEHFYLYESY